MIEKENIEIIHENIEELEIDVRWFMQNISNTNLSKITGLNVSDISAWKNHKRKWSHEKLLEVAEKLLD